MSWGLCRIPAGRVKQSFVAVCRAQIIHRKKNTDATEEENSKPLKFSTSKANPRDWSVDKSFGSGYQRPLWKVLPISLFLSGLVLWAILRKETEIDKILYRPIADILKETENDEKGK
uniref:Uncharacterized protein n=1 Tax=Pyxicephalus adspersus TaxID=30357 RepID=A0AAV3A886_PYXAD|nr:TPA: hypothetical protein GDO54_015270 [Pyxicephalus adspersus]